MQATERGERCVESRNEEKQDGSITRLLVYSFTRYEALPRNVTSEALPFDHESQGREA